MKPLHVAFVWHMHQPYYKDDLTSTYLLPWVRLRSAKDYYKMPALLDAYPKVRATFNLVPSLLAQIEDYGKAERTFSPHYRPVLPLICHVDSARSANPQIQLPERHFSHREDAERQIELGMGLFERMLGRRPKGMWPSEMAVGESVIGLAEKARIDWMISDEEVLARSLEGNFNRDENLYQPKRVAREGGAVSMVFRDSQLSNVIGFDYQRMSSVDAARDLIGRLRRIRDVQGDRDFLAVIALDGENAWEFYPRDGHDFLNALYTELESSSDIVTTTVSDFLAEHPPQQLLHHLHTGSWIGASLDTWIGDPEHNIAWYLLAETRDWLDAQSQQRPKESQQAALAGRGAVVTEGSDWFWWFSRKHDSGMDPIWDNQFRLHLRNVYKLMGARAPARLFQPIIKRAPTPERGVPSTLISPASKHDPAWAQAGYYLVGSGFGALHRPAGVIERVYYGNDDEKMYFRIDSPRSGSELEQQKIEFWLYISGPPAVDGKGDLELPLPKTAMTDLGFEPSYVVRITPRVQGGKVTVARVLEPQSVAVTDASWDVEDPFAIAIPFGRLGTHGGDALELAVVVSREGRDIEIVPPSGGLGLRVPGLTRAVEVASAKHLKVLVATAELAPFAKLGGVSDVAASLSKELLRLGHDVRVVLPRYRQVDIGRYGIRS